MINTIEVFIDETGQGYMTRESDNQELISLFGTDTLPTPFLRDTPQHLVIETLKQLNPEKNVVFIAK